MPISDRAKDLVVEIARELNDVMEVTEDDLSVVYAAFDRVAALIDRELGE